MKIGILGAGHIAAKVSATLNKMESVECYAVSSRNLQKAREFAREHSFRKAYGSYMELIEDPQVDLIYVTTPNSHHFEHVKMCLEHGKAVLCEKSFTTSLSQAEELVATARKNKVLLAEAIWTRYMPFTRTINEVLGSGIIGKPYLLTANLGYAIEWKERVIRPELGGGALLDLGVYCLNFALMHFGSDIREIKSSCIKGEYGVDMQETISFIYRDSRMACLCASALCATDRQAVISGNQGYMIIDNVNNPRELTVFDKMGQIIGHHKAPECISGYEYEFEACRDALDKGLSEVPQMPLDETLRVMRIMESLLQEWKVCLCTESRPDDRIRAGK